MKHLNEELLRINELMGNPLKEKIKIEESTPNIVKNLLRLVGRSSDDIARSSDDIAKLAGRTAKTDWVSKGFKSLDDAVEKAKAGDKKALSALVSDTSAAYTNIAIPLGKNIFDDYVRLLDDVLKDPVKYGLKPSTTNIGQGTRRKLLQMILNDGKSVTQGARTAGKGLTQTISKIKDVKQGSTEFIKTIEQNVINNTNITNIYSNKNYIFIVDDLVSKGVSKAVAQDTAMSIMVNRPIINVNQTVINKITKIDDFVMGNRNNINIVNIEKNTIKNVKTPKPGTGKTAGGGRSKGSLTGLNENIIKEYRRLLKEWQKLNPGKKAGQGTRERLIKEATLIIERGGGNIKSLTWPQWLAVGAVAGITGIGLWNLLSDNEEITPEDMPLVDDVDNGIIPPIYGDDETNTGSDESESDEFYRGELGTRVLRDEEQPQGDDVEDLQRRLNKLFQFGLVVDGIYGPDTTSKVKEFQRRADISVDGDFGPNSYKALLSIESGNTDRTETESSSSTAPEDDLETMEPVIVTNIENKKKEMQDAGVGNVPEEDIIIVQAPENVPQSVTDKVIVRGAKQCPDGKTPVLVKSKEKEVNRKNKKKRKTVAVYRCRKV